MTHRFNTVKWPVHVAKGDIVHCGMLAISPESLAHCGEEWEADRLACRRKVWNSRLSP